MKPHRKSRPAKHGGNGPSSVTRISKPRDKPPEQCQPCYTAGLAYSLSKLVCADCRS